MLKWMGSLNMRVSSRTLLIISVVWALFLVFARPMTHNPYVKLYLDNDNEFAVRITLDNSLIFDLEKLTHSYTYVKRNVVHAFKVTDPITHELLEEVTIDSIQGKGTAVVYNVTKRNSYRFEEGYYVSK
jgi:hypothetical protein